MIPLGSDAKAYWLSTGPRATWAATVTNGFHVGPAPASLQEMKTIKDVELPFNKGDADVSTRGNGRYKATQGGQREISIDLPMVWDTTDTAFMALFSAWISDATVAVALMEGDKAIVGNLGFWADFSVMNMKKGEKLGDAQEMIFTVKPGYSAVAPEFVKVASS